MRYITKEMLLEAVEHKVPLFEDGDEFGDDVLHLMIDGGFRARYGKGLKKQQLLSNLSVIDVRHDRTTCNPLKWKTTCHYCGATVDIPVIKTDLIKYKYACMLVLHAQDHDKYSFEFNGKKYSVRILDLLLELKLHNIVTCTECRKSIIQSFNRHCIDYCESNNKVKYWKDYFAFVRNRPNSCRRDIEYQSPFSGYVSRFFFNTSNELMEVEDAITRQTYYADGRIEPLPAKTRKWHDDVEVHESIAAKSRQAATVEEIPSVPKSSPQQTEVPRQTTATDLFLQRYCRPSDADASMTDFDQISNTENLNEHQLQENLRAMLYKDFVKTIYWKSIVMRRKWMDGFKCTRCGSSDNLCVHHLTYDHHGDERHHFEDLITVCKDCHAQIHKDAGDI